MLKKRLKQKSEGGIEVVVATLIAVFVIGIIMVYFTENMIPVNTKIKAETIVRKYSLKEEENGYLSDENISAIESEFKTIGISNVNISATTSPVTYGSDVYLNVSYKDNVKKITVTNSIVPSFTSEEKIVNIQKSSTSKKVIVP
ncbi:hypothetical protein [Clostridium felsineum]|uniref:Uncharacterized protein n=1 Tax=Clostridium felsineum TaxID=36839 RepID=A0A1S8LD85_9CLOT|nr:hypothetical protein [Clostridium felsineum]URZ05897.1 hypothetical protein CLROS_012290 [Clostridium felsineum]URZ10934.1 hypothetical protein CROST_016500 [Clostridium felsineum]